MRSREELAAAGALGEVSREEAAEMSALGMSQDEIYAMEIAAAALAVATVHDAMPPALAARLGGSPSPTARVVTLRTKKTDLWRGVSWVAAPAMFLLLLLPVLPPWTPSGRSTSPERTQPHPR